MLTALQSSSIRASCLCIFFKDKDLTSFLSAGPGVPSRFRVVLLERVEANLELLQIASLAGTDSVHALTISLCARFNRPSGVRAFAEHSRAVRIEHLVDNLTGIVSDLEMPHPVGISARQGSRPPVCKIEIQLSGFRAGADIQL